MIIYYNQLGNDKIFNIYIFKYNKHLIKNSIIQFRQYNYILEILKISKYYFLQINLFYYILNK